MNSKERVKAALAREDLDRVPIWMWYHPETVRGLAAFLEVPEDRVADALGDDIRQRWVGNNYAMEGIVHERDGEGHVDDWGIEWVKDGPFNQIRRYPLAEASEAEIAAYVYPYERAEALLGQMEAELAEGDARFLGCDVSPCLFEMICRLRGMEETALDLAARPRIAETMLQAAERFSVYLAETACERYPIDWLWTGDDVGGQEAMVMSPRCWREMIAPHLARIVAVGKGQGLPVAYHSCGAIRAIIPDLIAMGIDVLNPIQSNCPGMAAGELAREFGSEMAFMGGVDTHELLPRGSSAEVYDATRRLIDVMTQHGGGYILAASHAVPPETPIENILAMYAAAGEPREAIMDRAAAVRRAVVA